MKIQLLIQFPTIFCKLNITIIFLPVILEVRTFTKLVVYPESFLSKRATNVILKLKQPLAACDSAQHVLPSNPLVDRRRQSTNSLFSFLLLNVKFEMACILIAKAIFLQVIVECEQLVIWRVEKSGVNDQGQRIDTSWFVIKGRCISCKLQSNLGSILSLVLFFLSIKSNEV